MAMMPKTGNVEIKLNVIAVKLETCIKRVYTISLPRNGGLADDDQTGQECVRVTI